MGAWIESGRTSKALYSVNNVAPRVGAWIESIASVIFMAGDEVAPRVGAWIESTKGFSGDYPTCVAPRVGAWIERHITCDILCSQQSLPVWERGLKASPIGFLSSLSRRSPCGSVD